MPTAAPPGDPLASWLGVCLWLAALAVAGAAFAATRRGPDPQAGPGRNSWLALTAWVPLVLVLAWRALGQVTTTGTDVFAAHEAGALAALGLVGLALAAAVSRSGFGLKRWLLVGLQAFTLLAGTLLLLGHKTLLLENTGYDMQLLLPGALIGACALTRPRPWRRSDGWLGLGAFAVTLGFAATAPVVGGALVLMVGSLAAAAQTWRPGRGHAGPYLALLPAAVVALVLVAGFSFTRPDQSEAFRPAPTRTTGALLSNGLAADAGQASNTGGFEVREKIWLSLTRVARGQVEPLGTGQFRAAYPPLRDSEEIAMTTANHTVPFVTEVEHPHNDLALVVAEHGLWTGVLFALGLALAGAGALRALFRGHRVQPPRDAIAEAAPAHTDAALAVAALGVLLNGMYHAPLFASPPMALLGALLLGLMLPAIPRFAARVLVGGAALALVLALAWSTQRLEAFEARTVTPELAIDLERFVAEERQVGHLSAELLMHQARFSEAGSVPGPRFWWDAALVLRPFALEALVGSGLAALADGDWKAARDAWLRALEVDPASPLVQRNLRLLAADRVLAGNLYPALDVLGELVRATTPPQSDELAFNAYDPAHLSALADAQGGELAIAWRVAAHWLTARALFQEAGARAARTELERAAQLAGAVDAGAPRAALRVELAILRSLSGDVPGARTEVAEIPRADYDVWLAELPIDLQTPGKLIAPR